MARDTDKYRKLPGTKKGFLIGKYTLWQGSDHLLQVFSRVGVEEYKRFYFNDIQAVVTRKTAVGAAQNIAMGIMALIFILPAIYFGGGWSLFYGLVAVAMLLLLLIGFLKGPTCETKLMTAVQTEKLHTLHRLKNTAKVMDALRTSIHQTQGVLNREALDKMPARSIGSSNTRRLGPPQSTKATGLRNEKGRAHMGLFALMVFNGVLAGLGFFFTHVILTIISSTTILGMGIFVIVALVKQHDSNLDRTLKAITWASLGFISINFLAAYVISMVFAMQNPGVVYNQWEMFKSMSLLSSWESPLKMSFDVFTISGALLLGIPGLFMLYRPVSRSKPMASPSALKSSSPAAQRNTEAG